MPFGWKFWNKVARIAKWLMHRTKRETVWRSPLRRWPRLWSWCSDKCRRRARNILDRWTTAEAKAQFRERRKQLLAPVPFRNIVGNALIIAREEEGARGRLLFVTDPVGPAPDTERITFDLEALLDEEPGE